MIRCPPTTASRLELPPNPRSGERSMSSTSKRPGEVGLRGKHHALRERKKNERERQPGIRSQTNGREIPPPLTPAVRHSRERHRVDRSAWPGQRPLNSRFFCV